MDLEKDKARLFEYLKGQINDKKVLEAMYRIPRDLFIPDDLKQHSYEDRPIGIGYGQTISQPFIVALMTQALNLKGDEKVLEIGTGSGYQTAILAELAKRVISVERIPQLARAAEKVLNELGYHNVNVYVSSKSLGWKQDEPYDAIMVTAAAPCIPQALVDQLVQKGKLVIPVGSRWEQELLFLVKDERKNIINSLGYCRFVPLIGDDAWSE